MVAGTQTIEHQFRPIAFQVALKEDQWYYERFFQAIKKGIKQFYDFEYSPSYIMSDFDESISGAARLAFPNSRQLKCYFHLKKNVERKLREHGLKSHEEEILDDIKFISEATDQYEFAQLSDLFLLKIKEIEAKNLTNEEKSEKKSFGEYFDKQYLNKDRCNWYIAASSPGIGNTNNCLESFNKSLKGSYFTHRMDIGKSTDIFIYISLLIIFFI
jgi:hypothetical protein